MKRTKRARSDEARVCFRATDSSQSLSGGMSQIGMSKCKNSTTPTSFGHPTTVVTVGYT